MCECNFLIFDAGRIIRTINFHLESLLSLKKSRLLQDLAESTSSLSGEKVLHIPIIFYFIFKIYLRNKDGFKVFGETTFIYTFYVGGYFVDYNTNTFKSYQRY